MHAVWYVLEDGAAADPNEVTPDAHGVLRHASGVAVAYGPHGPRSRGVDLDDVAAGRIKVAAPAAAEKPTKPARDRQMKPKPGVAYETR